MEGGGKQPGLRPPPAAERVREQMEGRGAGGEDAIHEEDDEEAAWREKGNAKEMTRRWLQGFTAEDILRDKTLLRQQLEASCYGFVFCSAEISITRSCLARRCG